VIISSAETKSHVCANCALAALKDSNLLSLPRYGFLLKDVTQVSLLDFELRGCTYSFPKVLQSFSGYRLSNLIADMSIVSSILIDAINCKL
jgi:hypothetical protein